MTAFLVFFGLAALLVVGGVRGSLNLRPHRLSTGQLLSGLRRSSATPMHHPQHDYKTSHYYQKAWITMILVLFSVIILMIAFFGAAATH